MRKIPLSEALPNLIVIATVVTLFVVFMINMFPPLKDAVIIDDSSSTSENSSVFVREGNVNSSADMSENISSTGSTKTQNTKININTASVSELMTLDGIGEVKANAIVEYRTKNGLFKSIDELMLVSGIGEKTLEKNRDRITV